MTDYGSHETPCRYAMDRWSKNRRNGNHVLVIWCKLMRVECVRCVWFGDENK